MAQSLHAWRSVIGALGLYAGLLGPAGCISTQAAQQDTGGSGAAGTTAQRGEALSQAAPPQCGPTDSTVSCCLKQHPGEWERCGAMPPQEAPAQAPKQAPRTEPAPEPVPLPTDVAPPNRRRREQQCREHYLQCISLGGEYEKRGQHGRSICQSCYDTCKAEGSWPAHVNEFECLGGT